MPLPCATFSGDDTWTGMDDDMGFGQESDPVGCDYHCIPCPLYNDIGTGVTDHGGRWLNWTRDEPSRDAYGNFTPLLSNQPQLVPVKLNLRRAACWKNRQSDSDVAGKECDISFCACDGQRDVDYGNQAGKNDPACREGIENGVLRKAMMPDDFFFTGHNLPNIASQAMDCRTEQPPQLYSLPVRSESDRGTAYQMHSVRDLYCTFGFNAILYGMQVSSSRCYPAWGAPLYWNNHTRHRWGRWYVPAISARMGQPPGHGYRPAVDALIEVQNAALAYVEADRALGFLGILHFDQVAKTQYERDYPNETLPFWYRKFLASDYTGPPVPEQPPPVFPPVFLEFEGRTRWGRQPVHIKIGIVEGLFLLHAVLAYIKHRTISIHTPETGEDGRNSYEHQIWPSMRVRIQLKFAVRAYPVEGVEYIARRPRSDGGYDDVPMEIVNPSSRRSQDMPVMDPPLDEIEFILPDAEGNDRPFTPPLEVDWYGSKQALSSGEGVWENRLTEADQVVFRGSHTTENACLAVVERFGEDDPVVVPGAPTVHDEPNKIQHYLGSVSFYIGPTG